MNVNSLEKIDCSMVVSGRSGVLITNRREAPNMSSRCPSVSRSMRTDRTESEVAFLQRLMVAESTNSSAESVSVGSQSQVEISVALPPPGAAQVVDESTVFSEFVQLAVWKWKSSFI